MKNDMKRKGFYLDDRFNPPPRLDGSSWPGDELTAPNGSSWAGGGLTPSPRSSRTNCARGTGGVGRVEPGGVDGVELGADDSIESRGDSLKDVGDHLPVVGQISNRCCLLCSSTKFIKRTTFSHLHLLFDDLAIYNTIILLDWLFTE